MVKLNSGILIDILWMKNGREALFLMTIAFAFPALMCAYKCIHWRSNHHIICCRSIVKIVFLLFAIVNARCMDWSHQRFNYVFLFFRKKISPTVPVFPWKRKLWLHLLHSIRAVRGLLSMKQLKKVIKKWTQVYLSYFHGFMLMKNVWS